MGILDKLFSEQNEELIPSNNATITTNEKEDMQKKTETINEPSTPVQKLSNHDQRLKLESEMAELANKYGKLRNSLKLRLFAEHDELISDKEETESAISGLRAQQKSFHTQKNNLVAEDDAELYEQLENNKQQYGNQTELIKKYEEQNNEIVSQLTDNTQELNKISTSIENNKQAEDNLSEEIKGETDLKKMYELMENQKKAVANLYEEREQLEATRTELLSVKNKLTEENQQLVNSINQTSDTASKIRSKITQLEKQIKENTQRRTKNISQLVGQLNTMANDLETRDRHLDQVNKQIDILNKKIQDTFQSDYLVRNVTFSANKNYTILQPTVDINEELTKNLFEFVSNNTENKATLISTLPSNKMTGKNIFSLYSYLQYSENPSSKKVTINDKDEWITVAEEDLTKVFDGQRNLLMTIKYTDNQISSITYYTDERVNKINIYNENGILSKSQFYTEKGSIDEENYYRTDGSTVLTKQFENDQLTSIQMFDENGLQTNVFNSELQLAKWWFDKVTNQKENIVVIGDPTDEIFKDIIADTNNPVESLVFLNNVHSNIGRVRALLHGKPVINNLLVTTDEDLQSIEDITDRDLSVSVINEKIYSNNSQTLPNSLS